MSKLPNTIEGWNKELEFRIRTVSGISEPLGPNFREIINVLSSTLFEYQTAFEELVAHSGLTPVKEEVVPLEERILTVTYEVSATDYGVFHRFAKLHSTTANSNPELTPDAQRAFESYRSRKITYDNSKKVMVLEWRDGKPIPPYNFER